VCLVSCKKTRASNGETLAHAYCAACHEFPQPDLLDKKTWVDKVLPAMAPRVGVRPTTLAGEMSRDPNVRVLTTSVSPEDWQKIVGYFRDDAPDSLPYQSWPVVAQTDPALFRIKPFARGIQSSGINTLLKIDSLHRRIFIGEAGSNTLGVFDWNRRLLSTLKLGSPPTDLIVDGSRVFVLESGILDPNDQPKGSLVEYELAGSGSLQLKGVVIDSLFRPVQVRPIDLGDGRQSLVTCEYGNNLGRLALYRYDGSRYHREILDPSPGAIRVEIRDLNGDGAPDIVALLAQADERIVLFQNDGRGKFSGERLLARFPPVYGSTYFSMNDFNGDGKLDILYVNGDNFDYSRVLKPYHGVRILENDGRNSFHERYFFPIYGAARAAAVDFDRDGDLDLLVTSNFADFDRHPERGIVFLENVGRYQFRPSVFTAASANQWNLAATADINGDGWPDAIIAAMDLGSVARLQRSIAADTLRTTHEAILFLENSMKPNASGAH
jgi:hypothetical protein